MVAVIKCLYFFLVSFLVLTTSCESGKQDDQTQRKELELNQKEQELLAREQFVKQKEAELLTREMLLDSSSNKLTDSASKKNMEDSLSALRPQIPGLYHVTMKCIETNCTGSAVGDTKNEQWSIAYEQNSVIIKAMSDKKIIRIYKGGFLGPAIELQAQPDSLTALQAGKIIVRLQETNDSRLEGVREITRQNDCRVVFDLDLRKQ